MYTLKNETLEVQILDPQADQERFGVRYCTGGYIYQIVDSRFGELLSGPTYPHSFNWFDGQGIPDAFNLSPLRPADSTDAMALIIGIGMCDMQAKQIIELCQWDVSHESNAIRMHTNHTYQGFGVDLERTVGLYGRTIRSATRLKNTGSAAIPIRWFPHPFYPYPEGDELCRFNFPVSMPANAFYEVGEGGFVCRRSWPWNEGHFQAFDHTAQSNLMIVQKHPALGLIAATCSYTPGFFPIWGNQYTFSWEPFLERTLAPGQETGWWIDYDF